MNLPCLPLRAPDGSEVVVSLFGAHVLSWRTAEGRERLFMSPRSALDGLSPLRGGVPIVFPQFANYGHLPPHGFARVSNWSLVGTGQDARGSFAHLSLTVTPSEAWPFACTCQYIVFLSDNSLELQFKVINEDEVDIQFQAALHTYLSLEDVERVCVEGLENAAYLDRSDADAACIQRQALLTLQGPVDRIYPKAPAQLVVREPGRAMQVWQQGFADAVVWNPGEKRCTQIPDMDPTSYRSMLCVEAAHVVTPVLLMPGAQWLGVQRLTVL